jgi:hypothetical protein
MSYRRRYSPAQWIAALDREIALRERVFPRRVRDRKMTQPEADYEIDIMRDLREALAAKLEHNREAARASAPTLFS